ncbi:MAG TPA: hypothetical protein VHN11_08095, partial [Xanthobacteraceae bacterium]|jgi:hypothetical protein|nr:hypothetical protein [Xanthobacteraceae bacterium]
MNKEQIPRNAAFLLPPQPNSGIPEFGIKNAEVGTIRLRMLGGITFLFGELPMLLSADEILRSLKGSLRLLQRQADGFRAFDTSVEGVWRSFSAIILTTPAFLVILADQRLQLGADRAVAGLFGDPGLVIRETIIYIVSWIAFPLVMIGFVNLMGLGKRYASYIVAYNWSGVIVSLTLSLPTTLRVLGLAQVEHAAFFTAMLTVVLLQYRWFLARTALGITEGLAIAVVALDIATDIGVASLMRTLASGI